MSVLAPDNAPDSVSEPTVSVPPSARVAPLATVTAAPSASKLAPPSVSVPLLTLTLPAPAVPLSATAPATASVPVPRPAFTVPPLSV